MVKLGPIDKLRLEDFEPNAKLATGRLRKYWEKLGFTRIGRSPYYACCRCPTAVQGSMRFVTFSRHEPLAAGPPSRLPVELGSPRHRPAAAQRDSG